MLRSFINQILCFFFLFLVLDSKFYNGSNMTTLLLQNAKTTANLEKMLFPNKMQKEESAITSKRVRFIGGTVSRHLIVTPVNMLQNQWK